MNKTPALDYPKSWRHLVQRLGLGNFFDWWLGELSTLFRRMLAGASKPALERWMPVKISGSLVTFYSAVHGKATEAGRLDMASLDATGQRQAFQAELHRINPQKHDIALYLPQEQVLCKRLFFPLATEENLRQVIAFDMDRHTPFNAGQVYFDYRLVQRGKQLEIALAVAPRDAIDEPLRQLAAWGTQASAVLVDGDTADEKPWNLLPDDLQKMSRDTRMPRLNTALAAGIVVLLCIALVLPVWQKRETALALQPLQDKARKQAEDAENLRRQLDALLAEYNYLLDKKRGAPPVVAVLEDVTRILPDDTWVHQFGVNGKEMIIQGETASSSKLAGLFEQAKTLHDASFRSPLTQGQGANSERFQLAAETRPLPLAETGFQPPTPAQNNSDAGSQPVGGETMKANGKDGAPNTGTAPGSAPAARTGGQP